MTSQMLRDGIWLGFRGVGSKHYKMFLSTTPRFAKVIRINHLFTKVRLNIMRDLSLVSHSIGDVPGIPW